MEKVKSLRERLETMSPSEVEAALSLTAEGDITYCAKQLEGIDNDREEAAAEFEAQLAALTN